MIDMYEKKKGMSKLTSYNKITETEMSILVRTGKVCIVNSSDDALSHFREHKLTNAILLTHNSVDLAYEHEITMFDEKAFSDKITELCKYSVNQCVYICNELVSDYFVPVHSDLRLTSSYDIISDMTYVRFTKKD